MTNYSDELKEDKPHIIMGKKIFTMALKCPTCHGFSQLGIEQVKSTCPKCNKPITREIHLKQDGEYQKSFSQMALWLLMKYLGEQNEVSIYYTEEYQEAMRGIISVLENIGVFEITAPKSIVTKNEDSQTYTSNKVVISLKEEPAYYKDRR